MATGDDPVACGAAALVDAGFLDGGVGVGAGFRDGGVGVGTGGRAADRGGGTRRFTSPAAPPEGDAVAPAAVLVPVPVFPAFPCISRSKYAVTQSARGGNPNARMAR